jgi:hypothetical protein
MWREDLNMWVMVPMHPDEDFNIVVPPAKQKKVILRSFPKFEPIVFKSSPEQKSRFTASVPKNIPTPKKK